MLLYFIIFWIALVLLLIFPNKTRSSKTVFSFFWFALALFVGLGDMLGGYDRYIYGEFFDALADSISLGYSLTQTDVYNFYKQESGYVFTNYLISVITHNRYFFILILTLLIYGLVYRSIIKFSSSYFFTVILFLGLMFFFSFTYLRQIIAAAVVWQSIQAIIDRKLWKFLIIVLIAFSFHNSALIFIPAYFIPVRKFQRSSIIIIAIIALIIGVLGFHAQLFEAYGELSEARFRAAGYASDSSGFRIEYLLEASLFLSIILFCYRYISPTKKDIVLLNLGIASCLILLAFIKSVNGGRLSWFYMIGIFMTLSNLSTVKQLRRQTWYSLTLILISLGLYTRVLIGWPTFYPYKTFLTPGYVEDAWHVHDIYEYNFQYDYDKFHR